MADKMVYVVDVMPSIKGSPKVEVITMDELAVQLSDGWEIVSQSDGRAIPWEPAPKKPVLGERTILRRREDNRGLSVSGSGRMSDVGGTVTLRDEFGRERQVTSSEALGESLRQLSLSMQDQARGTGHLGAPGRHQIPGVTVISAEIVAKAFDIGMQAGIAGAAKITNPFPGGTEAHTVWLRGYAQGMKMPAQDVGTPELERAFIEGKNTAEAFGAEDEVTCPYRGRLKREWERGYVAGGGTVIPEGG
jgi:ribosome modulation factor